MTEATAERDETAVSAALVRHDIDDRERLAVAPVIDGINPRRLALIQSQIAPGCDHAEVGHFLELCAHYELDPFAREAWCCKGKNGRLLIMVGRDGLRKIGQRNGLHIDGDVIREKDEFTLCRTPDGNRTVTHSYGHPKARGAVVGAWAECRMGGPHGKPMGYFYAPLDEYLPKNVSEHSPWSKQVGVMILAAAERQAIRQATPLGGLLTEGENEVVDDHYRSVGEGVGDGRPLGIALPDEVEAVIARAEKLGHAMLADRATMELHVDGQSEEKVATKVAEWTQELDAMPVDAVVVPEAAEAPIGPTEPSSPVPTSMATDSAQEPDTDVQEDAVDVPDPERIEALRRRAETLLNDADALDEDGNHGDADLAREEAELIMSQLEAATDEDQGQLL